MKNFLTFTTLLVLLTSSAFSAEFYVNKKDMERTIQAAGIGMLTGAIIRLGDYESRRSISGAMRSYSMLKNSDCVKMQF